jgi:pimeloyl-ACP methyl ester carboxylesterase
MRSALAIVVDPDGVAPPPSQVDVQVVCSSRAEMEREFGHLRRDGEEWQMLTGYLTTHVTSVRETVVVLADPRVGVPLLLHAKEVLEMLAFAGMEIACMFRSPVGAGWIRDEQTWAQIFSRRSMAPSAGGGMSTGAKMDMALRRVAIGSKFIHVGQIGCATIAAKIPSVEAIIERSMQLVSSPSVDAHFSIHRVHATTSPAAPCVLFFPGIFSTLDYLMTVPAFHTVLRLWDAYANVYMFEYDRMSGDMDVNVACILRAIDACAELRRRRLLLVGFSLGSVFVQHAYPRLARRVLGVALLSPLTSSVAVEAMWMWSTFVVAYIMASRLGVRKMFGVQYPRDLTSLFATISVATNYGGAPYTSTFVDCCRSCPLFVAAYEGDRLVHVDHTRALPRRLFTGAQAEAGLRKRVIICTHNDVSNHGVIYNSEANQHLDAWLARVVGSTKPWGERSVRLRARALPPAPAHPAAPELVDVIEKVAHAVGEDVDRIIGVLRAVGVAH